jgi:hypothetical protein
MFKEGTVSADFAKRVPIWICTVLKVIDFKLLSLPLSTAYVVEGLESMTSNPITSLAWVRTPGDGFLLLQKLSSLL